MSIAASDYSTETGQVGQLSNLLLYLLGKPLSVTRECPQHGTLSPAFEIGLRQFGPYAWDPPSQNGLFASPRTPEPRRSVTCARLHAYRVRFVHVALTAHRVRSSLEGRPRHDAVRPSDTGPRRVESTESGPPSRQLAASERGVRGRTGAASGPAPSVPGRGLRRQRRAARGGGVPTGVGRAREELSRGARGGSESTTPG